jgi:dipeptidyl aminopeptidase/acylaminoacyl peptidase
VIEAELSPSGRRLAITTAARGEGRIGVYVFDLQNDPPTASAAAVFSDADVPAIDWLDDERLLFSVVDLQAAGGEDYRVGRGLFTVRHDGKELRQLIERHGRAMVRDGNHRSKTLHFNHRLLHVPRLGADGQRQEIVVGELTGQGNDLHEVRPLWLDPRSGRTRSFDLAGLPAGVQAWWFSPHGEVRAVLTRREGRERLYWHRPEAQEPAQRWQLLTEGSLWRLPFWPAWVGPGEQLYVNHPHGPGGERVISAFDFEARKPAPEPLVLVPGFDFRGRLIGETDRLQGVRVDADTEQTIWFDATRKDLQAVADAALPGRVNRISCSRCEADDAVMLVHSYSDRQPGQLWLYRKGQTKPWQPVSAVQPGIDAKQMASVELHRIKARDGLDLPVWVTTPPGETKKPRPTVVLVHGGPWVRGGGWRWQGLQQFLASRGYLVIEPEFRGSDGYGLKHLRAGFKQWGQTMQDDVSDALRWAQAQGLASDKACIAGASYGGYSTLMGLIRDPAQYRCGIAWAAVTDPLLYLEGAWWVRDDISEAGRRYSLPDRVGDAERDREMLLANSPVEQAHRIKSPLLLAFGSDDRRVPLAHGKRLQEALRKAGQEPVWVVYDGEAHGWRLESNQVDFARRVEAFLGTHLPVQ